MKAIINCGGLGTRLPEISKTIPKPMVEIHGKPVLFWLIQNLKKYEINDIYITLHYLPERIIEYFGDGNKFGVTIQYSYEKKPMGTGGALISIVNNFTDDILILYGDVICDVNFEKLLTFHKKNNALISIVIHQSPHLEDSDLVECNNSYKLTKIFKKPHRYIPENPHNLAAIYLFNPKVVPFLSLTPPFDISHDLLPHVLKKGGNVFCYNTQEFIMDIGTPERLQKAKKLFKL